MLMLTNCLAACAHLTITVSEIERDIGQNRNFLYPLAFDTPVRGVLVGIAPPRLVRKKTRMAWLSDGEKISTISIFVLAQLTNVTDRRTNGQTDRQTPHHHHHHHRRRFCVHLQR